MNLHGPYETDNIFAKIISGERPCVKVYEEGNNISFMDVFAQSKAHCLVVPNAPSRTFLETNAKDIGRLFGTAQRIAKAVEAALKPDGIRIAQFNGAPAGQTVFHTHVHIIPVYAGSPLGEHGGDMADMEKLAKIAEQISAYL